MVYAVMTIRINVDLYLTILIRVDIQVVFCDFKKKNKKTIGSENTIKSKTLFVLFDRSTLVRIELFSEIRLSVSNTVAKSRPLAELYVEFHERRGGGVKVTKQNNRNLIGNTVYYSKPNIKGICFVTPTT